MYLAFHLRHRKRDILALQILDLQILPNQILLAAF